MRRDVCTQRGDNAWACTMGSELKTGYAVVTSFRFEHGRTHVGILEGVIGMEAGGWNGVFGVGSNWRWALHTLHTYTWQF